MATKAKCPKCGSVMDLPEMGTGGQICCPGCGVTLTPPASSAPQAAVPAGTPPAGPTPPGAPAPVGGIGAAQSKTLLVTLGAMAVGVIVAGLLLAAVFSRGAASAWDYLPHDSKVVAVVNVPAILESDFFGRVRSTEQYKNIEEQSVERTGLKPDEIARMTIGVPMVPPGSDITAKAGEEVVLVLECTRAVDQDDFLRRAKTGDTPWEEEQVGSATIFHAGDTAFHFPDERMIVGGSPDALRAALDPNRTAGLNEPMQQLVDSLAVGRAVAVAGLMPSEMPELPPGAPVPPDLVQKIEAMTLHADAGADLKLEMLLRCRDAETAESLGKMADGLLEMAKMNKEMPEEAGQLIRSVEIKSSDRELRGSMTIPGSLVDKAIEQGVPGAPFGN